MLASGSMILPWGRVRETPPALRQQAIDLAYGDLCEQDRRYVDEAIDTLICYVKRKRPETRLSPKDALYILGSAILFDRVTDPRKGKD